jgi:4-amino-4-deoxy-L-arabinose transferase-like glycosyltransferase
MTNVRSRWIATLRSILIGFGFFVLGSVSEVWLQQHAHTRTTATITDALLGIAVGLLVLFYERRQQRNIIRKLEVIRLMNHHVRNSLQVISFAASVPRQEALEAEIRNAVERIEWALREVLPGQRQDIENLLFDPHVSAEKMKTAV